MATNIRVPFQEAIDEPRLLRPWFSDLSLPQQVALKVMYGCELSDNVRDDRGWSELDHWAALQEHRTEDDLGYITGVDPVPYAPQEYREVWMIAGIRAGKALALDTEVPTPTGYTTIGNIQEGDTLIGADGNPTVVTATTPVMQGKRCFRLTFSDDTDIVADADHRWEVVGYKERKNASRRWYNNDIVFETKTTAELAAGPLAGRKKKPQLNWAVRVASPWQLSSKRFEIDPYLLGCWLGDGTSACGAITTADQEIVEAFSAAGYSVPPMGSTPYGYRINGSKLYDRKLGFTSQLRRAGVLNNKHIPAKYLRGSFKQRLALLQGLMDTDGYIRPRGDSCEFYNTNYTLAEQARELISTLGIKSTLRCKDAKLNGRVIGPVYTVAFRPPWPVFRLKRKRDAQHFKVAPECGFRYIEKIEAVPSVPVRCLTVDSPQHLFLVGRTGIPTHNSTSLAATITAYEATCGGHEAHTRGDRPSICLQIAQDLRLAKYSLHTIKGIIESMAFCGGWIKDVTADRIDLSNKVTITVCPPTVKSIRGYDAPVAVLDEVGVWYTEADSANPDFEIYQQCVSRQAQYEFPKVVGISSPWATQGILYDRYQAGTNGVKLVCNDCREASTPDPTCPACERLRVPHLGRLVLHGTSAGLGSPAVKNDWLIVQQAADPRTFARECLGRFQESISGFLDGAKIDAAIDRGVIERIPMPDNVYVAAMDPAFRNDSFAFTVVHMDPTKGVVQDVVRRWTPMPGMTLNPAEILAEIAHLMKQYRTFVIYSDQYQFESLNQLAIGLGVAIEPVDFTATSKAGIYGNLKSLLNQNKIRLLDNPATIAELKQLESRLTGGGNMQISAPRGRNDDLATVTALSAQKCIWMFPVMKQTTPVEPTIFDHINKQVRRKLEQQGVRVM